MSGTTKDPRTISGRLAVTVEDMAKTTLFRDVDLGLIIHRLQACRQRVIAAGEIVINEGDANDTLFIVLDGRLQIRLKSHVQVDVSVAMTGDCVGEMSVIDGRNATATVRAEIDTVLLELPGDLIWTMIDHTTLVSRNLLYVLAGRLRMGNRVITAGHEEKAKFQRFATYDLLTGLRNRRWFEEELQRRFEDSRVDGSALSLILYDVDHFKRFNDSYGHEAGDLVLQKVAQATQQAVRGSDYPARYGGEEFVVLLPGSSLDDAAMVADRIRLTVSAQQAIHEGRTLPTVTVSLGLAQFDADTSPRDLVRRADEALYQAKQSGRNRVCGGTK